jgi:hypothetical protein
VTQRRHKEVDKDQEVKEPSRPVQANLRPEFRKATATPQTDETVNILIKIFMSTDHTLTEKSQAHDATIRSSADKSIEIIPPK